MSPHIHPRTNPKSAHEKQATIQDFKGWVSLIFTKVSLR